MENRQHNMRFVQICMWSQITDVLYNMNQQDALFIFNLFQ